MDDQSLSIRVAECLTILNEIQHYRYWFANPAGIATELREREAVTRARELDKLPKRNRELERNRELPKPRDEEWVRAQALARLPGLYGLLHQQFNWLIDAARRHDKDARPLERVLDVVRSSEAMQELPVDHGVSDELLRETRAALGRLCGKQFEQSNQAEAPFVATPLQNAIHKALEGRSLTKAALADKICGGEGTRLYKSGGIKELRERGIVEHKKGVGYYRPDAPPPEITITPAKPRQN